MKKVILLFAFAFAMVFYGCATTGNSSETSYRANLGTATQPDIVRIIPNMFSRYNFSIYRQEVTGDGIWFESEWKERDLFEDESVMGASDARTRITVTARSRTAQASSLHRVNLEIENHLRVEDEDGSEYWDRSTITEEAAVYFRDIERTIRNELASGIRRN
jgi:hypothetical protein